MNSGDLKKKGMKLGRGSRGRVGEEIKGRGWVGLIKARGIHV